MAIVDEKLDLMPIRVPASAATHEGFREWARSSERPRGVRLDFIQGRIYFEIKSDLSGFQLPKGSLTFDGFRAWVTSDEFPNNLRASFIQDVVLIDMSPEEIETHIKVKTEITRVVGNVCKELNTGALLCDGLFLTNAAVGLSTEPDGTFVTWERFRSGDVRLVARKDHPREFTELQGTPDLVIEIISRSTVGKDKRELRSTYFRAGIPEYWLIDARGEEIVFEILLRGDQDYEPALADQGWVRSLAFDRRFRLEREPDPLGMWQYTLDVN